MFNSCVLSIILSLRVFVDGFYLFSMGVLFMLLLLYLFLVVFFSFVMLLGVLCRLNLFFDWIHCSIIKSVCLHFDGVALCQKETKHTYFTYIFLMNCSIIFWAVQITIPMWGYYMFTETTSYTFKYLFLTKIRDKKSENISLIVFLQISLF